MSLGCSKTAPCVCRSDHSLLNAFAVLTPCRKETPRDVSAQFKEDSKGPINPVSQPVQPMAPKGTGKAVMKAVDGNEATANIAYAFNDVSFIYPITPATPMGEWVDQWSNEGRINLHNNVMEVRASIQSHAAWHAHGGVQSCTAWQQLVLHPRWTPA